jgi:hypothetical protein
MQARNLMKRETAFESYNLGERAIVVGGGLGGLSASAVCKRPTAAMREKAKR